MDEEAAGGCHGCLICGTIKRPLRCENCVNQALGEKRRISDTACASGEAARGRLAAALEEREAGQQRRQRLQQAEQATQAAAVRAAAARERLQQVRTAVQELEERDEARRRAIMAADKQLAARRAEVLDAVVPDMLRTKNLQLGLVMDQLVAQQRSKLLVLQQILPLTLSPVRGEVPAALARASGFWTKRPAPAPGGQHPKKPIVAVKDLRLPEGLSRIGCDTGQEAQELGSALGYLLLYLELAAAYLAAPLLHQPHFQGSWSSLWQPGSFWAPGPAAPSAVLRLSFAPAAPCSDISATNAAAASPPARMPSQPAAHPMEAVSALAQRSARTIWCAALAPAADGGLLSVTQRRVMLSLLHGGGVKGGVAAGYHACSGDSGGGDRGDRAGGRGTGAAAAAPAAAAQPGEDEVRAAELALGRALHALHRSAGAIVADQLGPGKLRVQPEWGAFAALAALVDTALRPVYRQGARARAASQLFGGAASSLLALAPSLPLHPCDSRIAGVSTLFPASDPDADAAEWDFVARPGVAWGGGSAGLLLPPPPSQPEAVEHWTRALLLDTHTPDEAAPPAAAWRALDAIQQSAGFLRRELRPHLAAVAARLPHPHLPGGRGGSGGRALPR